MPRGLKGEKHPSDMIGAVVKVLHIAKGDIEDELTEDGKR